MATEVIRKFLSLQSASGILIICAALLSLACANIPVLSGLYEGLLHTPVEIRVGALELNKNVLLLINDGLMAIFFLLVALEIKREFLGGELKGRIALPLVAAIGGVLAPALIYIAVTAGDPIASRGWAIPAATDIAFALGVLSLLGTRAPLALKVFLTAIAVFDDLAAIVIIALFYTADLSWPALALAALGLVILTSFNRAGVVRPAAYLLVGALIWLCVIKSGVHATLAGVVVGLAIPFQSRAKNAAETTSPSTDLEHILHPWVAFMILPVFAFANAGVNFAGIGVETLFSTTTLGISLGLLVGKPLGIMACSHVAVHMGIAQLPSELGWRQIVGVAFLAGIGFTMSLFIGSLAFEYEAVAYEAATRVGVLGGSCLAAVIGYLVLRFTPLPPNTDPPAAT